MRPLSIPRLIAFLLVAGAATTGTPSVTRAQGEPETCFAPGATPSGRDSASATAPARAPGERQPASPIPRNLVPLLRDAGRGAALAGSVQFPMVYEAAYPKGPLVLRRSVRPTYTQRAGLAGATGWVQAFPKSSRWIYVPVPPCGRPGG